MRRMVPARKIYACQHHPPGKGFDFWRSVSEYIDTRRSREFRHNTVLQVPSELGDRPWGASK